MSEQKEGNELSNILTTKSIVQSEDNSTSRLVYKLVRVGDDGTVLPTTEDEVVQVESFVEGDTSLGRSDAEASDAVLENEDNVEIIDDKQEFENQDDEKDMKWPEDLEAERRRLLARLEVLDSMLSKVKTEEPKRSIMERKNGDSTCLYSNLSRTTVKYKRQRRPNPKYLNFDARKKLFPTSLHTTIFSAGEPSSLLSAGFNISRPLLNGDVLEKTPALSPRTLNCGLTSHTCKKVVVHVGHSFISNSDIAGQGNEGPKSTFSLDDLSIRELHEAFKTTFGRETSVKDKHWLKRQISMGMSRLHEATSRDEESKGKIQAPVLHELPLQARVEVLTSAEQPAPFSSPFSSIKVNDKGLCEGWDKVIDVPYQSNRGADCGIDTNGSLPEVLPEKSIAASPTTGSASSILCKTGSDSNLASTIEGQSMDGKRQRKPNRRYLEEEVDAIASTGNVISLIPTTDPIRAQILSKGESRPSSKITTAIVADMSRLNSLRSSSLYTSSQSGTSQGRRSKVGSNTQKRKADGRAAKLVKMARSARGYQHSSENNVRRVKFILPTTYGQDKNKTLELYDGRTDQVSCLLPTVSDQMFGNLQSKDLEHNLNTNSELVATVPTANGGTRRKHHRPWTLREVMTLVEGVARCGGGKWADIKKFAFSSVSYRTAVDLKDKWRNLLRASRSQLQSARQGESRKRHFSVSIPGPILARVRELAALQNQTAGIPLVSATIRSGRLVQRK